jgi:transcriptional regulator with XRE-family HTH domain
MIYRERLKSLMDAKGVGRTELAGAIGITYQGVRKVFDSNGAFGSENNLRAAAFFEVDPRWLATGVGDKALKNPVTSADSGQASSDAINEKVILSATAIELARLFDLLPTSAKIPRATAVLSTC